MKLAILWLAVMALAALTVLPRMKEQRNQANDLGVNVHQVWKKQVFRYRLPLTPEEVLARLADGLPCAGVAYDFDAETLCITLRSELPDGHVPVQFQLAFAAGEMHLTRLSRTLNAAPVMLAMGGFWREKLGATIEECAE